MHFYIATVLLTTLLTDLTSGQAIEMNGFAEIMPGSDPFNYLKRGTDWPGTCQTSLSMTPIDVTEYPADPAHFQVVTSQNSSFREMRTDMGPVRKHDMVFTSMMGNGLFWFFNYTVTQNVLGYDVTHTTAEVHFMTPSAHLFNGVRYPLEIHFGLALKQPDGPVFSTMDLFILYKEGQPDPFLTQLMGDAKEADLRLLFPNGPIIDDYYMYSGSVDMPWTECWEPLTWAMPNYILEASPEQIQFWKELYLLETNDQSGWGDIRDVQPLNDRIIYHYITPGSEDSQTSFLA